MVTAIIMRVFSEFSSELFGYIDLYSTLLSNIKIYKINYWLTGVVTACEFCFGLTIWEYVDHSIPVFMLIEVCIVTAGMYFGAWLLKHKKDIKKWLKIRNKKISKGMKKHWENRKNIGGSDGKENTGKTNESNKVQGSDNKDTLYGDVPVQELWNTPYRPGDKHR